MGAREDFMLVRRASVTLEKRDGLDDLNRAVFELLREVSAREVDFIRAARKGTGLDKVVSLAYTVLGEKRPAAVGAVQ